MELKTLIARHFGSTWLSFPQPVQDILHISFLSSDVAVKAWFSTDGQTKASKQCDFPEVILNV